jgi:diguanylate cyclase (GGDEF)-like protein/PAS domain S-box-containing protein
MVDRTWGTGHAADAERMFRRLLETQAEAIVIADGDGRIVIVNEQAESMFGYSRDELLGTRVEMLIPEQLRERHVHERSEYSAHPHTRPMGIGMDLAARRKDGTEFPVEVSLSTLTTNDGPLITSRISDITARKRAEAALQEAEERFRLAFDHAPIGMAIVLLDGRMTRVNEALSEITGYEEHALLGLELDALAHPDDGALDAAKNEQLLAGTIRSYRIEQRLINAAGETLWTNVSVSLVRDAGGRALHYIVQIEDISSRKLMEERLRRLADFDSLTGVRNRRQFERDLFRQVANCRRYGEEAALLMIDLDDFKRINDTYGHRVGDDVLKAVAAAVRQRLRATDTVARLGGDEFAVLLPHVSAAKAAAVAEDLGRCIGAVTVQAGGRSLRPSASIGVAHIDENVASKDAVLSSADDAMYAEKRARGSSGGPLARNEIEIQHGRS